MSLRTGAIITGSVFLIIAVIHFIASVVLMCGTSDSQILESGSLEDYSQDDLQKWLVEAYKKALKISQERSIESTKSPNSFLTGTVEAEITTSPHFSTVVIQRLKSAQLVVSIIHILSNLALIVGAVKRNGNFVSLWLWLQMVLFLVCVLGCAIITFIIFSIGLSYTGATLIAIFLLLSSLFVYCYAKVYKFYHELYVPLCPSTKLDTNNPSKIAYELQNFSPDKEYI